MEARLRHIRPKRRTKDEAPRVGSRSPTATGLLPTAACHYNTRYVLLLGLYASPVKPELRTSRYILFAYAVHW